MEQERYATYMQRRMREEDMEQGKENALQHAKRMIWVTFTKEGIHKYPAALDDPSLATGDEYDVSFLGYPHRHIFHFKIGIAVTHNDRDIEFIQFKRWLVKLYEGELNVDYKSCEMMSDDLYEKINDKYPGREVHIDISEDGENGAHIEYAKSQRSKAMSYWEEKPEVVNIFDDLDKFRVFCRNYGFKFDEKDLYNKNSRTWQFFLDPSKLRKNRNKSKDKFAKGRKHN